MIPMKAPQNVLSLSVGGSQFPVVNGVVQVPPAYVKHALAHKFLLLDGKNADELIASDFEAALAKAQAAIPIVGLKARDGMKSLSIEGTIYTVGEDGYVEVPSNVAGVAKLLGCSDAPVRAKAAPAKASEQPGKGAAPASEAALPTPKQVGAMSDADLLAFLKGHGVEFLADAKRKDMNKAAYELINRLNKEAEEAAEAAEAEEERRAALTPEEREAEDKAKAEADNKKE
jgi:hypothetical protein